MEATTRATDDDIQRELKGYADLGVIEYVLPTEPIGERWVIGLDGRILNLDPDQTAAFLAGASAVAHFMAARRMGLR